MAKIKSNASLDIKNILIGNKADLEDQIQIQKGTTEKFKYDYELYFFMDTSAKNGMNAQRFIS